MIWGAVSLLQHSLYFPSRSSEGPVHWGLTWSSGCLSFQDFSLEVHRLLLSELPKGVLLQVQSWGSKCSRTQPFPGVLELSPGSRSCNPGCSFPSTREQGSPSMWEFKTRMFNRGLRSLCLVLGHLIASFDQQVHSQNCILVWDVLCLTSNQRSSTYWSRAPSLSWSSLKSFARISPNIVGKFLNHLLQCPFGNGCRLFFWGLEQ